jgi:hypothetical protein
MKIWSWTVDDWNAAFQILPIIFLVGTVATGIGKVWTDRIIKQRGALELAAAKQELADAKTATAKVQADLDAQREQTAKNKKEILEVQAKFRRRTLTPQERDNMVNFLHVYRRLANEAKDKYGESFMIVFPSGEGEPSQFANLLYHLFRNAEWSVQIHDVQYTEHVTGMSIVVRDSQNLPRYAELLQRALTELKLPVSVREEKGMEAKSTFLEIGSLN